jgi:DNA-directed RNA polymerase subunit RPC12/RpoP
MVYRMKEHRCPLCGSGNIYRSKRRGIAERVIGRFTPIRPFRCNDCSRRIFALEAAGPAVKTA